MPTAAYVLGPKGPLAERLEGYEVREGQLAMARAVESALDERALLMVEAGTGTGKTLAYLAPALLSGQRVLVSTATRNLQEQIFTKDLPLLLSFLDIEAEVAILKGRANYLCLERLEHMPPPSASDPEELEAYLTIEGWARDTQTGDRAEVRDVAEDHPLWKGLTSTSESCTGSLCNFYDECHVMHARRRAVKANVLIVNHHLFFADLALREVWDAALIPRPDAIIFDEAHGLEDIACRFFGFAVSNWRLDQLFREVRTGLEKQRSLGSAEQTMIRGCQFQADSLFRCFGYHEQGWTRLRESSLPSGVQQAVQELEEQLAGLQNMIGRNSVTGTPLAALEERCMRIRQALLDALDFQGEELIHCVERRGKGTFLHTLPIRVAEQLGESLFLGNQSLVFTSATLTTSGSDDGKGFRHFGERLGIGAEARTRVVPSPFDYQEQALLYLPRDLPAPKDGDFPEAAADEIARIVEKTEGRAFVLFTSHRMMNICHQLLRERIPFDTFVQGEAPKDALLRKFKENGRAVLFGTSSFWEGVDVAGQSLSCVILDKLPFPSPGDPLIEARLEQIKEEGGSSFQKYLLPTAILALKQGFGRLIRRRDDRGIVAILDRRIHTHGYGRAFLSALPPCPRTDDFDVLESWCRENLPE